MLNCLFYIHSHSGGRQLRLVMTDIKRLCVCCKTAVASWIQRVRCKCTHSAKSAGVFIPVYRIISWIVRTSGKSKTPASIFYASRCSKNFDAINIWLDTTQMGAETHAGFHVLSVTHVWFLTRIIKRQCVLVELPNAQFNENLFCCSLDTIW